MKDKVKVGILGFAHGHVNAYCNQWRERPELGIEVVAGWDHDAERLDQAVQNHGVNPHSKVAALLDDKDIQAVVVSAETSLHAAAGTGTMSSS